MIITKKKVVKSGLSEKKMDLNEKQTFMNCGKFSFIIAFEMTYIFLYTFCNKRFESDPMSMLYNIINSSYFIILLTLG